MKGRPRIPVETVDELLVESRHRCNVCVRDVAVIHHIDRIESNGGNSKSNLIVLCPECHRRAHLPSSFFERRISKNQLRLYKKRWVEFCKSYPSIPVERPMTLYTFLNSPRIRTLFRQLTTPNEESRILVRVTGSRLTETIPYAQDERMMQTILDRVDFTNLGVLDSVVEASAVSKIEGLPVVTVQGFYGKGLKSPKYYVDHPSTKLPFLHWRRILKNVVVGVKIVFDPRYIVSMTGYVEMSGHHRLVCYGFVKRVRINGKVAEVDLMPVAIGIRSPISLINAEIRAIQ
jgi:HNH endonuclease